MSFEAHAGSATRSGLRAASSRSSAVAWRRCTAPMGAMGVEDMELDESVRGRLLPRRGEAFRGEESMPFPSEKSFETLAFTAAIGALVLLLTAGSVKLLHDSGERVTLCVTGELVRLVGSELGLESARARRSRFECTRRGECSRERGGSADIGGVHKECALELCEPPRLNSGLVSLEVPTEEELELATLDRPASIALS
mmetsp:Transcript_2145/g.5005  ORF Transcript_2145/g.5005 Transcript_2145/m.5005 type:complete len:198 (+) Transcript_2145:917-1510(+)